MEEQTGNTEATQEVAESYTLSIQDLEDIRDYIEAGMQEDAEDKLVELAGKIKQDAVFSQVGNLTRDLHDALTDFVEDERIRVIADVEMPDASDRLKYIIEMTNSAANKTLDAVDSCVPMVRNLTFTIDSLLPAWKELMNGKIDRFEFVTLCHKVDNLMTKTKDSASDLSRQLNNIMMAQDYQDLTGQMLQKVIKLVTEVEDKLVDFLVAFAKNPDTKSKSEAEKLQGITPTGPALDKDKSSEKVASSQDEVDDLLASLGF